MAIAQVFGIGAIFWFKDLASKNIRNAQRNVAGLQKQFGLYGPMMDKTSYGLTQLGIGFKSVAYGAAMLAPSFAGISGIKFEEKVWRTAKVMDMADSSVSGLRDKIVQLSMNTPFSVDNITDALYELGSAGLAAKEALDLSSTALMFGRVAGIGYEQSTAMIGKGMRAFNLETKDATRLLDLMVNMEAQSLVHYKDMPQVFARIAEAAKLTGRSPFEVAGIATMLADIGMDPRRAGTHTRQFVTSMEQGRVASWMQKQGLSAFDKDNKRIPLPIVMQQINDKLDEMGNKKGYKGDVLKAWKGAQLGDLFLKNAAGIIPEAANLMYTDKKTGKKTFGFAALYERTMALGKEGTYKEREKGFKNLNVYKYETAINNLKTAWISFSIVAIPITIKIMNKLGKVFEFLTKFINSHPGVIRTSISILGFIGTIKLTFGVFTMLAGGINTLLGAAGMAGGLRAAIPALQLFIEGVRGGGGLLATFRSVTAAATVGTSAINGLSVGIVAASTAAVVWAGILARQLYLENEKLKLSREVQKETEVKAVDVFNARYKTNIAKNDSAIISTMMGVMSEAARYDALNPNAKPEDREKFLSKIAAKGIESEVTGSGLTSESAKSALRERLVEMFKRNQGELTKALESAKLNVNVKLIIDGKEVAAIVQRVEKEKEESKGKGVTPWWRPTGLISPGGPF